jgi:predicted DNA-binding transcriptional regulator AlpA
MSHQPDQTLITPRQLAVRWECSEATLAKWRVNGDGPPFVRLGRKIAYRVADIEMWLDARRAASTSEYIGR